MDNTVKAQLIQTTGGIVGDLMRMWFSRPAMRVAQVETPQAVVNQLSEPVKQTYVPPTPPVSQPERKLTTNELSGDANKEEDYRFECLPAWTTLYGKERVAEITDFGSANYGNEYGVYTHTGKHQTVNGYMSRDYAGKMMNLQFWYTNIPLVITPNHPILGVQNVRTPQNDLWRWNGGIDEDRLDWFETGNATNRDFIAFPRITETIDMDIISPQLSELFGWYVAEGNVDKTSGTITISLGNHETEWIWLQSKKKRLNQ